MKDYTSTEPVFSESIPIVEENDLVNAENNNAAAKQLLQNLLVLRAAMVIKEEGKSLVSDEERNLWNMIYEQAIGYTDQKIADLINGAPSTLDTLGEIAAAMGENEDVVQALEAAIGTKANQVEMESLLGTKLEKTGDAKDNTITYSSSDTSSPSSWAEIALFKTGEKISTFANKVSTMMKNMRFLWKLCGNNDISKLGDGTITGALNSLNTGLSGKAASSHTHNYLPLSGGIVTGTITLDGNNHQIRPAKSGTCSVGASNYAFTDGFISNLHSLKIMLEDGNFNVQSEALQSRNYANSAWAPVYASAFSEQSSRRYKDNIADMDEDTARQLLQYRIVTYDYKNREDGINCQGMIAEEVAEVNPYPVVYDAENNPDGLDYSKFVPQLIKMIQLQQKEIDSLKELLHLSHR